MSDDTLFDFPCDFPIKVMGRDTARFRDTARRLVEKHAGPLPDDAIQTASSRNGRYVSVTVTVRAQSRQQLDAIYHDVSAHEDVLWAL